MDERQSVFIATSMDGFIARPEGDLDWLTGNDINSDDEDYGYNVFMDSVDALAMGRHTYEKVLSFGEWPYSKKVVVLTSQALPIPRKLSGKVATASGSPKEIVDTLSNEGFNHLYIDGGKTIQRFLRAGLIQEMTITRIPILIGEGIPLFGPLEQDIKLEHISTDTYEGGFVQSRYRVNHNA